jgi:hypothetical protein
MTHKLLLLVPVVLAACDASPAERDARPPPGDLGPAPETGMPVGDGPAGDSVIQPDQLAADAGGKNIFTRRYVLCRFKLDTQETTDGVMKLMQRAAKAGYNGVALGSGGGEYYSLEKASAGYLANFAKVRAEAKKLGLTLIPYAIGQTTPAWQDATLQEAFPVKDTRFVVSGQTATVKADPAPAVKNAGFESGTASWKVDSSTVSADSATGHAGGSLLIKDPKVNTPYGHARAWQEVAVTPWRAYKVSVWIRTASFSEPSAIKLFVYSASMKKLFANRNHPLGAATPLATQGWKLYTIHFNSLEHSAARIYLTATSRSATGKVWFDDVKVEEAGLYETIRRPSLPVTVRAEGGAKTFKESADYAVEAQALSIPAGSAIQSGDTLRVSWYQRANMDNWSRAPAAWCNQKVFDIAKDDIQRLYQLFDKPPGFFYIIDEWRVAYWDPECIAKYKSAADYVADVARKIEAQIRALDPKIEVYVWNDMYDPHHNATSDYYMINGSLEGSWSGLSKQTVIMNWMDNREANQRYWGGLDPQHPQVSFEQILAGYYGSLDRIKQSLAVLDKLELEGIRGVKGFMFTQWDPGFDEAYKDLEAAATIIKASGRWGSGPAF